ncbi:MAG: hypothetical protein ABIM99_00465, partial [Candidatus Dojkabacteria bacterium]
MKPFRTNKFFKLLIPIVIIAGIFAFIVKSKADTAFDIPSTTISQNGSPWWDNNYAFRRKVVASEGVDQVIKLNHSQLVIDNKSASDASDLKIITYEDGSFDEISIDVTDPDQIETYVSFTYQNKKSELYLYYGNKSDLPKPNNRDIKYANVNQTATIMEEEVPVLSIIIQKKWNLKEKESKMLIEVSDSSTADNSAYYYLVDDSVVPFDLEIQNNLATV